MPSNHDGWGEIFEQLRIVEQVNAAGFHDITAQQINAPFTFALNNIPFPVDGVQIEVDGGYEGATTVNLVEAKVGARSNISVRQLLSYSRAPRSLPPESRTVRI